MNRYRTRSKEVTAIQLKKCMTIQGIRADAGDWLIDDGKDQFFLTNDEFKATYEPIIQTAPVTWPTNPFPDTYPGTTDHFPWPTNPQWPNGPIYWTSGPNFTQCAGSFTPNIPSGTGMVNPPFSTGINERVGGSFMMTRSGNDGQWSCINIPKCIDGQFHSFVTRFKMGDGKNAYTRCSKCGKEPKEVQC